MSIVGNEVFRHLVKPLTLAIVKPFYTIDQLIIVCCSMMVSSLFIEDSWVALSWYFSSQWGCCLFDLFTISIFVIFAKNKKTKKKRLNCLTRAILSWNLLHTQLGINLYNFTNLLSSLLWVEFELDIKLILSYSFCCYVLLIVHCSLLHWQVYCFIFC